MLGIFYLCIGLGTAVGYMVGGSLSQMHGWRAPFYIAAIPGFMLAALLSLIPEPPRGLQDTLAETRERATVRGLVRNGAFWTATLGMAMWTFGVGAIQVWMPTFLSRIRHQPLEQANLIFGGMTAFNAVFATLLGGWIGDRVLRSNRGAYYIVSSVTMLIAAPVMIVAITTRGPLMYPSMFLTEFLLFLNMAPLERRHRQFRRRPHPRHRHRRQPVHHSPARRRFFSHPGGIHLRPQFAANRISCRGRRRGHCLRHPLLRQALRASHCG